MGPSGNGLVGADERGGKPAESRAFRLSAAPVRLQKAVLRSRENAAVKRRKASRSASWAGVPSRWRDRPNRKAATVRRSAQRLSALCPLGLGDISQKRPGACSPERWSLAS